MRSCVADKFVLTPPHAKAQIQTDAGEVRSAGLVVTRADARFTPTRLG